MSIDCNQLLDANFEEAIIGGIEQMAVQIKIFIIDNLTYLCCAIGEGDAAGRLMIQLNNLKRDMRSLSLSSTYAQTLFGLSHHIQRPCRSKRLYNFFDSVFTIGKSAQDGGLRYVKQLKVRYGTFSHDADNVIVYETRWMLSCSSCSSYSTEKEHLKKLGDNESSPRDCQILQLSQSGKSVREIASQVNCGKSTVNRIIQRSKESKTQVSQVSHCPNHRCGTMGQDKNMRQSTIKNGLSYGQLFITEV